MGPVKLFWRSNKTWLLQLNDCFFWYSFDKEILNTVACVSDWLTCFSNVFLTYICKYYFEYLNKCALYNVDHSYEIVASVPLSSISDVKKFSKKNLPKDKQMFLMDGFEILCSNIQSYRVRSVPLIFVNNHYITKNNKMTV